MKALRICALWALCLGAALCVASPASARGITISSAVATHRTEDPLTTDFTASGTADLDAQDVFQRIALLIDGVEAEMSYNWSDPNWSAYHRPGNHVGGNRSLRAKLFVTNQGVPQNATSDAVTVNCDL